MFPKPRNRLDKRLFFREPDSLVAQVATDGEAVLGAAEQGDLPWEAYFYEQFLGVVAQVAGEDGVGFCHGVFVLRAAAGGVC